MASIGKRLQKAQRGGNLTVADLARWFAVPYPTMRGWVRDGTEPGGGPGDRRAMEAALELLEDKIASRKQFPLPRMSPRARMAFIEQIRP